METETAVDRIVRGENITGKIICPLSTKQKVSPMIPLETTGPKVLKDAHMVVLNTPRKTFYSIRFEECSGTFRVRKASGALGKVWDKRTWEFSTLDEAERLLSRRLKEKTDPGRHSPRKYSIKYLLPGSANAGGE